MVRIRMARGGSNRTLFYHIVVADSRHARDGRFIERIGFFNPVEYHRKYKGLYLNADRIKYWLSNGAQISDRVSMLIKNYKIIEK